MAKLTLDDIASGYGSTTKLNSNNDKLEAAFENTLSRDGTAPNAMEANLDMNSYRILNLPNAVNNSEPVTLGQANTLAGVENPLTQNSVGAVLWPRTAAETTAGVTPTNYYYAPGDLRRYGATLDGVTDDAAAVSAWLDVGAQGVPLTSGHGTALCSGWAVKTLTSDIRINAPGLTITGPNMSTDFVVFTAGSLRCHGVTFDTWDDVIRAGALTADITIELVQCRNIDSTRFVSRATGDINAFAMTLYADGCEIDHSGVAAGTATRGFRVYSAYKDVRIVNCRFKNLNGSAIWIGYNTYADQNYFDKSVVANNTFDGMVEPAVDECHAVIVYGRNTVITGNSIANVTSGDPTSCEGIYTKCRHAVISNNSFRDAGESEAAIAIKGSIFGQTVTPQGYAVIVSGNNIAFSSNTGTDGIFISQEDVLCEGNIIDSADGYGIYTENIPLNNIVIRGNIIRRGTGTAGIYCQHNGVGLHIDNNIVWEQDHASSVPVGYGIFVNPSSNTLSDVTVNGNRVLIDDGSSATSSVRGISFNRQVAIDNVQVIGNNLNVAHATLTEYGINLYGTGGSDNWIIKDNDLTDVAANPLGASGGSMPTTLDYGVRSDGGTGGTGSAGAGNQYVEIEVNGTTYKVLHDGTV